MQTNQDSNMCSASQTLRNLAHKLLTGSECAELKSAIQEFKKDHSVLMLCTFLYKILSTPEKMQILLAVYPMIPKDLQPDFDSICSLQFDNYDITVRPKILDKYGTKKAKKGSLTGNEQAPVMVSVEQLRRFHTPRDNYDTKQDSVIKILNTDKITGTKTTRKSNGVSHKRASLDRRTRTRTVDGGQQHRKCSKTADAVLNASETFSAWHCSGTLGPRVPPIELDTSQSSNNSFNSCQCSTYTPKNINVRKVKLERNEGQQSLGFAIRGGTDLKSGIYVSHVDVGGQAEIQGLRVGERILKVNDVTFKNVSHAEAVAVLKASCKLTIYAAPIGHMPGTTPNRNQRGNCSGHSACGEIVGSSAIESGIKSEKFKNITLVAQEDNWLGCSIRGGVDHGMNVTVANVDPDSPAYKAGLKKGQRIVKVNGVCVDKLTHMEVISLITASNSVSLEVKYDSPVSSFSSYVHQTTESCSQQMSKVNWQDFDKELINTLPLCTSTPLPPEDLPKLAVNTQSNCLSNPVHKYQESTIDSICVKSELDNAETELTFNTCNHTCGPNNVMCNSNQCYTKCKDSKFDNGTIKLNMDHKDIIKNAKIIDIVSKVPTRRQCHVKEIFANIPAESGKSQFCVDTSKPANSKALRSDSCRSPVTGSRTPQIERSNSMNIMGTPCSNITHETFPVTPQDQLQDARMIAKIQIQQELTGKHIILSQNVPSSQRPPLAAHFLRKVLNTTYKNSSGNAEIIRTDQKNSHGLPRKMAMLGISKWRSAYDLIAKGDLDED